MNSIWYFVLYSLLVISLFVTRYTLFAISLLFYKSLRIVLFLFFATFYMTIKYYFLFYFLSPLYYWQTNCPLFLPCLFAYMLATLKYLIIETLESDTNVSAQLVTVQNEHKFNNCPEYERFNPEKAFLKSYMKKQYYTGQCLFLITGYIQFKVRKWDSRYNLVTVELVLFPYHLIYLRRHLQSNFKPM